MDDRTARACRMVAPLAVVICCWAAGCSTGPAEIPPKGFLRDTARLRENSLSQGMYVQFDRPLANYDRILLERLVIRFTPQRPRPVSIRNPQAAETAYRAALAEALGEGGRFRIADAPGRGTLRIRAAVTDRFQRDEKEPAPGPATLELEALDALSGRRVFAVMDPAFAQRDSGGEHTTAEHAFAHFARRLRMRIDEIPFLADEQ